jgi:hypothetical protein
MVVPPACTRTARSDVGKLEKRLLHDAEAEAAGG